MNAVNEESIILAHTRIQPHIHRTPLFTSRFLNEYLESELYFKCENFQMTGSFKVRGATNSILKLDEKILEKGVATHSSGNHAQAIAYAAKMAKVAATVVMPKNSVAIKKAAVRDYGAKIIECEPTQESRELTLQKFIEQSGAVFIHPFNDYSVIEGQATCAKEIFEELHELDYVISPVGGGGLLSGTLLSAKYFSNDTKVIAAEPQGADDAYRSWKSGNIQKNAFTKTIADGLLTSLGDKTFSIIREYVHEIITVSDEEIIKAMKMVWERMKIIIEPSSACTLAAVIKQNPAFKGKKIALILTGGNVDITNLPF